MAHEQLNKHKCIFCNKLFYRKCGLISHLRVHTKENPFKCEHCDKRFTLSSLLQSHIRRSHSVDPLNGFEADCIFCDQQFKDKRTELQHLNIHTGEKPYFCQLCSKELMTGEALKRHEDRHSAKPAEKKFKCSICEASFKRKYHLKIHVQGVHSKDRLFKCDQCELCFKFKEALYKHKYVHMEGQFGCDQCGKLFKCPASLKIHIRSVHDKIRPYECSMCPLKFTQRGHWMNHMKLHTGEKHSNPIVCKLCNKSFTRKWSLKLHHRLVHTEVSAEDWLKCNLCDKRFKNQSYLNNHLKTHNTSGESHECMICNKTFSTRHSLNQHIKWHTAEKPFSCGTCGKEFTSSSNRRTHEKLHLPKKHKCNFCELKFHQAGNMRIHMKQRHNL